MSSSLFTLIAEMTHFWSVTSNPTQQYPPNVCTVCEEILCLLWGQNNDHHIQKSLPLVPVLNQMRPAFTLPACFFEIHFNIVSYLHTGPQVVSSRHIFQSHQCIHFWFLSRMAHALPISSFSIWSPYVSNFWLWSYSLHNFLQPHRQCLSIS